MVMLHELEVFYKENGILSTEFTCVHKLKCQGNCDNFTGPKSAFVGSGYEAHSLPRLLFLSLDSGGGNQDSQKRLPLSVRHQEEICTDVNSLRKNRHWYLTHELAWYIFKRFEPEIPIADVKLYFAHTNSAKCSVNNSSNKQAPSELFKNCRGYLSGELRVLSPKIIITQGDKAKDAIHSLQVPSIEAFDEYASIIQLNDQKVFWLHTYHPRHFKGFYKQLNRDQTSKVARGWIKYAELVYQFMQEKS